MDAPTRRHRIVERLSGTTTPVSATTLGEELGVSRQVIVGDVALLRSSGTPVLATSRGYLLARPATLPRRTVFVQHTRAQIEAEVTAVIGAGAWLLDTSIEHRLYGQITVDLHLRTPEDVRAFLERLPVSSTLDELTNGWHTHTLEAPSEEILDDAVARLEALGLTREPE